MAEARPLDGSFRDSWQLVGRHLVAFLLTVGVLEVIARALMITADIVTPIAVPARWDTTAATLASLGLTPERGAFTALGIVLVAFAHALGAILTDEAQRGQAGPGRAWRAFVARLPVIFATQVVLLALGSVAVGALVTVIGLPAVLRVFVIIILVGVVIWLALRWSLALTISALEGVGPATALRSSAALTSGAKGAIFGVGLGIGIVAGLPAFVVDLVAHLGPATGQPTSLVVARDVVAAPGLAAGAMVIAAFGALAYRRLQAARASLPQES